MSCSLLKLLLVLSRAVVHTTCVLIYIKLIKLPNSSNGKLGTNVSMGTSVFRLVAFLSLDYLGCLPEQFSF